MGCVVVGPSGVGKTVLWRTLGQALRKMGKNLKQYIMNPKAMPRACLLGSMDTQTQEWTDGVLTNSAREIVADNSDKGS